MFIARLVFLLGRNLPLRVLHALGGVIGWIAWHLQGSRRRLALCNVRLCFPELSRAEQRRIARRSFGHYYKTLLEYPLLWTGKAERVHGLVAETCGGELVDRALAEGKGLILAAMHLGSFEAGIIPLSAHYPLTGMYKPVKNRALDLLSQRGRSRFGAQLVAIVKRQDPRQGKRAVGSQLLRALKRGEVIYVLPDRDPPRGHGIYAPYFGIRAHSPVLAPKLVQATGAKLLICVGERLPGARGFRISFEEPPAGFDSPDLDVATAAINAALEARVRACPEQYWWAYKRFKRRPQDERCFYKDLDRDAPGARLRALLRFLLGRGTAPLRAS